MWFGTGVSFTSVQDQNGNFLVVSGGGTNAVVSYNIGSGNWTHLKGINLSSSSTEHD